MLTAIAVTIICLECGSEKPKDLKSDMVCTHPLGVWQFLRFSVGTDTITAAFCQRCLSCMAKRPIKDNNDDDEFCEVERLARQDLDMMNGIRARHEIVRLFTNHRMKLYLDGVRPLIEVGKGNNLAVTCMEGYHRHGQHA
ncbi:hypothetical protein BKA61DRAFT_583363 [Leptodontidium sp. MPI-SDFR-AT-0119]|nr:hypothetical protein BKA61DRAFT_583363 [Leptodontidium sp. MPI-SDFR-AT-0119]